MLSWRILIQSISDIKSVFNVKKSVDFLACLWIIVSVTRNLGFERIRVWKKVG